jgi:hypothetical protein
MAIPFQDAVLPGMNLRFPTAINPMVGRGSLVRFDYLFHAPGHDPQPLVLVTDVWEKYVRGIQLHYLTFPEIRSLLFPAPNVSICESQVFTYQYVKEKQYIVDRAFRQYKRNGMQNIRKLDCEFIVNALSITRSNDPSEIEAIRRSVQEQIRRLTNPQAASTEEAPF